MYPVVTHWAWSEDGWLYKGINITYEGEEVNIAYRVSFPVIWGKRRQINKLPKFWAAIREMDHLLKSVLDILKKIPH